MAAQSSIIYIGGMLDPPPTVRRRRGPGRPRKGMENQMSTTVVTPKSNPITRTVFDLESFDDVKLTKPFNPPTAPSSVEEALQVCGNDAQKLVGLIYAGMVAEARNTAYDSIEGFVTVVGEKPYTGKYADGAAGLKISAAILGLAKALGYSKSKTPEQKAAAKAKAADAIRSNPAILADILAN